MKCVTESICSESNFYDVESSSTSTLGEELTQFRNNLRYAQAHPNIKASSGFQPTKKAHSAVTTL